MVTKSLLSILSLITAIHTMSATVDAAEGARRSLGLARVAARGALIRKAARSGKSELEIIKRAAMELRPSEMMVAITTNILEREARPLVESAKSAISAAEIDPSDETIKTIHQTAQELEGVVGRAINITTAEVAACLADEESSSLSTSEIARISVRAARAAAAPISKEVRDLKEKTIGIAAFPYISAAEEAKISLGKAADKAWEAAELFEKAAATARSISEEGVAEPVNKTRAVLKSVSSEAKKAVDILAIAAEEAVMAEAAADEAKLLLGIVVDEVEKATARIEKVALISRRVTSVIEAAATVSKEEKRIASEIAALSGIVEVAGAAAVEKLLAAGRKLTVQGSLDVVTSLARVASEAKAASNVARKTADLVTGTYGLPIKH